MAPSTVRELHRSRT
ncbi:hypothetical protein A2U01_0102582, partial [Trifolium medium]|nr:hypothetical protein [Trifolium medium]